MHELVVLLALLAAFCVAIGMVTQHRVATDVPTEHGMTVVMVVTLVRSPLWWAGTVSIAVGYGFQALALAYGPLLLVQPLGQRRLQDRSREVALVDANLGPN